ncbi:1-phosphofructokinase family hexose kinase [Staphylococcus canis]|uniref:Tagatose-6-phosphate kinase n=1 Tax=Staphylococcus canis TaxID=2724942 RepID=A0ABS0T8R2_9STAP|nr:1-phosphofructokinase family hexose kinase [Staphylococcus canis]MBI5974960.1 1-phosphofructokinase family hexose kinase [Staphylococcus canis]
MIATHTFNPSIDITYSIDPIQVGEVNRVKDMIKNPGGKGINVTKVLDILNVPYRAYGYLGGSHGEWMKQALKDKHIETAFTDIKDETRQSLAINDGTSQTEVLEQGPTISKAEQEAYIETAKKGLAETTVVTISGSSPNLEDTSKFSHMQRVLELYQNSYNLVDTNAKELKQLLEEHLPIHCIKPNQSEFEMLIDASDLSIDACIHELKTHAFFKDIDVFLTLGGDGAIIKWKSDVYRATLPKKDIINPVGSGDSTVAGIAYSVHEQLEPEAMIKLALACGTSNALQAQTGHIDLEQVETIKKEIEVERV